MIETLLTGLVRFLGWLWTSALTLHHIAFFFIVVGGFVMFLGSVAQIYWRRALEKRAATLPPQPMTRVHIENLNITVELSRSQLRSLLSSEELPTLPPVADQADDEVD